MSRSLKKSIIAVSLLLFLGTPSWSATTYSTLPNPTDPYVAARYDDFYSYIPELLTQLGYDGFTESTGQGKLDLLLWVGNMQNDQTIGSFTLPKAISEPNKPTVIDGVEVWTDIWSVPVDLFADFLMTSYGSTIPVFAYDLNQQGNTPEDTAVIANARFYILDENKELVALWALDSEDNGDIDDDPYPHIGIFNPEATIMAPYNITIPTANGTIVINNLNIGSGSGDFVGYSPTMDLSKYTGGNYTFYFEPFFYNLNNGPENIWIEGSLRPFTPVPEPSTMILLGIGLAALTFVGRNVRK